MTCFCPISRAANDLLVVGTNAFVAYELFIGAKLPTGNEETEDFDLAWCRGSKVSLATPSTHPLPKNEAFDPMASLIEQEWLLKGTAVSVVVATVRGRAAPLARQITMTSRASGKPMPLAWVLGWGYTAWFSWFSWVSGIDSPLPSTSLTARPRHSHGASALTVGLQVFSSTDQDVDWSIITAATLMTSAPLLIGFLLFQRQFVQSFMRAGIK